jgi:histidyl-tRNA synthetase
VVYWHGPESPNPLLSFKSCGQSTSWISWVLVASAVCWGSGRTDQSGDETEGANLEEGQIDVILAFVSAGDPSRDTVLAALKDLVGDDPTGLQGVQELTEINQLLGAMGPMSQVVFDPTVVRGLEYYTGPVFEAALTFETVDDDGNAKQFGSVAGGGRYDDLVKRFTGEDVAACGASIGVDRLLAAIRTRRADSVESSGPVVVTVMDRAHLADYQSMVTEIRQAGIPAELYLGTSGFGKQLKYADKRNSRVVVIAGEREFDASSVVVRDMVVGAGRAAAIADRQEWLDDRSAQQQVPRSDLVAAVQAVLARA